MQTLSEAEKKEIKDYLCAKGLPTDMAVTFGDVTLPEDYSDVRTRSAITDFRTDLIRGKLTLNIPFVSANMESVTGLDMAVALGREGGLAFPPQSLPIEKRMDLIERVGRAECAFIKNPLVIAPEKTLGQAKAEMQKYGIHSLIVVDKKVRPVGILTKRDWFYENDDGKKVKDLMTSKIITAPVGVALDRAALILRKHKIEKLPLTDKTGKLRALITANGLFYHHHHSRALRDECGRFLRAGTVGIGKEFSVKHLREVELQAKNGIGVLLVDTARGFAVNMAEALCEIKKEFPKLPLLVGNVSTPEGAKFLFDCGADAVKIGIGPGSPCRTREVGIGIPQLTAVASAAVIAKKYGGTIVADGGMKSPGDIAKALIAGADVVMSGIIFARAKEAASPIYMDELGRPVRSYAGSASFHAQLQRLKTGGLDHLCRPEGVNTVVPVVGTVGEVVEDLLAGLKSTMAYIGARNIKELKAKGRFVLQTRAGLFEGIKK